MSAELRPHQDPVWTGLTGWVMEEDCQFWFYPTFPQSHHGVISPHDNAQGPYQTLESAIRHARRVHHE